MCIVARKTSVRPSPAALAAYIAVSALRISSSLVAPDSAGAMPTLARVNSSWPSITNGCSSPAWMRAAIVCASSGSSGSSTRTANSSPPRRATVSELRTQPSSRLATWRSSSSPAACPSESFTVLKSSRSTNRTAMPRPWRRVRATAWRTRSSNSERLGSAVSGSWKAWWRSWSSRLVRSPTSRTVTTSPWTDASSVRSSQLASTSTEPPPWCRARQRSVSWPSSLARTASEASVRAPRSSGWVSWASDEPSTDSGG